MRGRKFLWRIDVGKGLQIPKINPDAARALKPPPHAVLPLCKVLSERTAGRSPHHRSRGLRKSPRTDGRTGFVRTSNKRRVEFFNHIRRKKGTSHGILTT